MKRYEISGGEASSIAANAEREIAAGRLPPGARLPTVRGLASQLKVSPATVAAAYHMLRMRGLVSAAGRRGTIVSLRPPLITRAAPALPSGVRNLVDGSPDPHLLPDLQKALSRIRPEQIGYGAPYNRHDLLELARAAFRADGITAESISVLSGALDAIERILIASARPDDLIAVEDPGYPPLLDLIAALGMRVAPCKVDDCGVIPGDLGLALRAGATAVVVTPRAQNPTGAAFDKSRVRELRSILSRAPEVMIIEDDHAGPVSGAAALTLCDAGRPRWAVVRSLSKSFGPDLRIAFAAGDEITISRVEGRHRLGPGWVSHILQEATVAIWSDAASQRLVARAADTYTRRRTALISALQRRGIRAHGKSGLNVWVPVAGEESVVQSMLAAGWGIGGGQRYRVSSPPGVRISIASLTEEEAERLADDLRSSINPAQRSHYA